MEKPKFPKVVRFTPAEIKAIRNGFGLKMTQVQFARFFNLSTECIKSWEIGRSNPFGPSGIILQQLRRWVNEQAESKRHAHAKMLNKNKKGS